MAALNRAGWSPRPRVCGIVIYDISGALTPIAEASA